MALISLTELIENASHFGHRAERWNPKMAPYILGTRKSTHIIDLKETIKGLIRATELLKAITKKNGLVILVCTKKHLSDIVEAEAKRCGIPYVNKRWLGGTITNFDTIKKQITKLLNFEKMETDGSINQYTKKDQSLFQRELQRLRDNLGGLRELSRAPDAIIAVDQIRSKTVLDEAHKQNIPTICLIDTDGNPSDITLPIPINDDAIRSVSFALSKLADAVIEGKTELVITPIRVEEEKPAVTKKIVHFKKKPSAEKEDRREKETHPRTHSKK
ncbi:MAG: 30S ribosomal protein S2 [Planctomycetota bacterium]|nr:30S ribosomal protein S2 [Planctomycetota bacterium]MDI6786965.1 30S ribosomal protein S2 [Planctomycetota bacterium]